MTFVSLCSRYPKSRWVIVRESLPTLKRTTLVTFQAILNEGLSAHVQNFNRDTFTVTFTNGSELIFMAESFDQDKELNRFRGLEINGGGMDEINECRQETFYKLIERSGTWLKAKGNPRPVILATCNPTQNWVKSTFYDPWTSRTLNPRWAYIPARITDNPYIPQDYIDGLKANMPRLEYERFVNGDWEAIETDNRFATYFDESRHVKPCEFMPNRPLFISMDFNVEPFAFIFYHVWRDSDGDHIHIFDEAEISGGDIFKAADLIQFRYGKATWSATVTGDYNGNAKNLGARNGASHYIQLQRELKMQARQFQTSPNPRHVNSRNDLNYTLYHHPDLRIDPKCTGTIRDLQLVRADTDGSILKANRSDASQRADFMDAVRYAVNHKAVQDWLSLHQKQRNVIPSRNESMYPMPKHVDAAVMRDFGDIGNSR